MAKCKGTRIFKWALCVLMCVCVSEREKRESKAHVNEKRRKVQTTDRGEREKERVMSVMDGTD